MAKRKELKDLLFYADHLSRLGSDGECTCNEATGAFGCLLEDARYYADPDNGYAEMVPGIVLSARAVVKRLDWKTAA